MREITEAGRGSSVEAPQHVYKVLRPAEWAALQRDGRFAGSPDDRRDGFIHLSCWTQVQGTLDRHFSKPDDREVVVAAIPVADIVAGLRWEASRGGVLFPHLYAELRAEDIVRDYRVVRAADGNYSFPDMEPV